MSQTLNTALYGIERQALEVLRIEFEKYTSQGQILTPSFVQLLAKTHEMIMKGAKQRVGIDTNKSPRETLVELQQLVVEFQMLVEQENEIAEAGGLQ